MKNKLRQLFTNKEPRYISQKYIIAQYGNQFWIDLCERTSFLPIDFPLVERMYCICNDIFESPKCLTCKTPFTKKFKFNSFNDPVERYVERYCCDKCVTDFEYDMTTKHSDSDFNISEMRTLIETVDKKSLRRNFKFLNNLKNHLHSLNVDYTKMRCKDALFFFESDLKEYPKCRNCGTDITNFGNDNSYVKTFCSCKCSATFKDTTEKRLQTVNEKKYGNS